MELSVLAADAAGRPLGYSIAELAAMFAGWKPAEVRADAEACARLSSSIWWMASCCFAGTSP